MFFDIKMPGSKPDAVSSASIVLPDKPSGEYTVFISISRHEESLEDWKKMFLDEDDVSVIFEDISCIVAKGDTQGMQMADRLKIQLPENQMTVREENPVLLASKIESGKIDIAIMSKEMSDYLKISEKDMSNDICRIVIGKELV